jgi:acyl-CoA synthetase (NDP forming)/ribosomal protein S18 acetylase RimI-like enzyme
MNGESLRSEESLRDGRAVSVRALRVDDAAAVEGLWKRFDALERRRFLELAHLVSESPGDVTAARPPQAAGVVATVPGPVAHSVVGLARYELSAPGAAAFSVFVDPAYRRVGLGTLLLRHLAAAARHAGVGRLVSDLPARDRAILALVRELGLDYEERPSPTGVLATFAVAETDAYLDAVLADQRARARAALEPFLRPTSIAVVGASDRRTNIGGLVLSNVLASGFTGGLYPVNPKHDVVRGLAAFPDLSSCPAPPDLVVVAVPAPSVVGVVEEAGKVGSHAACVISAGFAEVGPEGQALQAELVARARAAGVRLVGPNCMGLASGGAASRFNATFSPTLPPPGRLALLTQSGGLGLAALDLLSGPSLGVSEFVAVGNSADLGPNDLLLYFDEDPTVGLVLAYLESVPDPRRFARIARSISRRKPVVVMKAGRTGAGRRAASSHTAALAASDQAVNALFHQAGVVRAETLEEMFDIAAVATAYPDIGGRRLAVLTNGGGPGILVADACEASGLLVPELSASVQGALRAGLPAEAAVGNPVDMVASASAVDYGRSLRILAAAEEVDAIIVVFIPPFLTSAEDVAAQISAAARELGPAKPIVAVFMTPDAAPPSLAEAGVPSFTFPERAAKALGRLAVWAEWRARPAGQVIFPEGMDAARGRSVVETILPGLSPEGWVDPAGCEGLLGAYGIPIVKSRRVRTPDEAAAAQAELEGTVAVKIASAIHKTDVGGVALGIGSPRGAAEAVREIRANLVRAGLAEDAEEFVVQEQVQDGVEMIVGVVHDPAFGPLAMVGLGGTAVEVLGDVALRLTPLSDLDVEEMIRSLRSYRLLTGYRRSPPLDVGALGEVLHRVSAMVEDIEEIAELDLNPLFVRPHGVVVADVRIRLAR